jgi:hypothetical protein
VRPPHRRRRPAVLAVLRAFQVEPWREGATRVTWSLMLYPTSPPSLPPWFRNRVVPKGESNGEPIAGPSATGTVHPSLA